MQWPILLQGSKRQHATGTSSKRPGQSSNSFCAPPKRKAKKPSLCQCQSLEVIENPESTSSADSAACSAIEIIPTPPSSRTTNHPRLMLPCQIDQRDSHNLAKSIERDCPARKRPMPTCRPICSSLTVPTLLPPSAGHVHHFLGHGFPYRRGQMEGEISAS